MVTQKRSKSRFIFEEWQNALDFSSFKITLTELISKYVHTNYAEGEEKEPAKLHLTMLYYPHFIHNRTLFSMEGIMIDFSILIDL